MLNLKAIAVAAIALPGAAHALTIDPFTTPSEAEVNSGSVGDTDSDGPVALSLGSRTNTVTITDVGLPGFANASSEIANNANGRFWISNNGSPATESDATLFYDFGTGLDLSGFVGFDFGTVFLAEQGFTFNLDAEVASSAGTGGTTFSFTDADIGTALTASFAAFAGVDFGDVESLTLTLSTAPGQGAGDVTLSGGVSVAPIPVPAALPLLASGLVALGALSRRRAARA